MPSPLPRRTLADWTPEAGDVTEWLARWEAAGWRVEAGPADTVVNGRALRRWAMIEQVSPSGGPT
ncbi:MAG: hypothetical protein KBB39_17940 [Phycicoccus sp.]|nr:hypothetical protein [Phycicoccus sp.]